MGVLYEHWDPIINECFYVGISNAAEDTRPYYYGSHNDDYDARVKNIYSQGLAPETRLVECSHLNKVEISQLEKLQIAYWRDLIGERLTNQTAGGEGALQEWTEELCTKHSEILLRPETVLKQQIVQKKVWDSRSCEERKAFGKKVSDGHKRNASLRDDKEKEEFSNRKKEAQNRPEVKTRKSRSNKITHNLLEVAEKKRLKQIDHWGSKTEEELKEHGRKGSKGKKLAKEMRSFDKQAELTEKLRKLHKDIYDSLPEEKKLERGRKISEGHRRRREAREAAKLKDK
jgi:hypothetical protein